MHSYNDLAKVRIVIFVRLAGFTGVISNFKVERQRIFPEAKMLIAGGAPKPEFLIFCLSWGILGIIFTSFGAQLRKAAPRLRAAPHVALLAALVGTPSCYPAALPSLVCFCLAFAKIVSEYWWITYTYLVRHYIRMYLYTYVLTYTHLYIKIYTDMHTRISLNMYTYIFIASLRFLLCLLREKSLSRGRRVLRTPPHFCLSKVSATRSDCSLKIC